MNDRDQSSPPERILHLWGFIKARSERQARNIVAALNIVRDGGTDWESGTDASILRGPEANAFATVFPGVHPVPDEDVAFLALSIYSRLCPLVARSRNLAPIEMLQASVSHSNPHGVQLWNRGEEAMLMPDAMRVIPIAEAVAAVVTGLDLNPPWLDWIVVPAVPAESGSDEAGFDAGSSFIEAGRKVRYMTMSDLRVRAMDLWHQRAQARKEELARSRFAPSI